MSYNDDLQAIADEIRALVRTYDPATEEEYHQRSARLIDKWKERGYDIYSAYTRTRKAYTRTRNDQFEKAVGVTLTVSVDDRREGCVRHLEIEL